MIAGGVVDPEQTTDHEEQEQCSKMHDIIKQYKLDGEFRSALLQKKNSLPRMTMM